MSQLFNDPTATLKSELRKLKAENTSLRQKLAAAMQQVKAPPPPIMSSDETALLSKKVGNQTDFIKIQTEELNKLRRELERARDKITSVHKEYSDRATLEDKERSAQESKMVEKMRLMEKKLKTREAKLEAAEAELVKLRGHISNGAPQVTTAASSPSSAVAVAEDPAKIERVRRMEELLAHLKESLSSFEGGGNFSSTTSTSRPAARKAPGQKRVRSPATEADGTPGGGSPGISNHLQNDAESAAHCASTVPVTTTIMSAEPKRRGRPPKAKGAASSQQQLTSPLPPTITIKKLTAEEFGVTVAATLRIGGVAVEFSGGDAITKYLGFSRQLSSASEAKALANALIAHFNGNKSDIVSKLVSHIASVHSCPFRVSVTKGVRALHILIADIVPIGVGEALMAALTTAALGVMGGDSAVAIDHSGQGVAFGHTIRILSESLHSLAVAASKAASATAADRIDVSRFALLPTLAAYDCVVAYQHTRNRERSNIHLSHAFSQLLSFVGGLLYQANNIKSIDTVKRSPLAISVQYTVAEAMKEWKQSADSRASPRLGPQDGGDDTTMGVYSLYQDVCEAAKWSGQVCPGGLPQLLGSFLTNLQSLEPTPSASTGAGPSSPQSLLNGRNWGLCTEPYKQLQMAARLVILTCGFSLGYQQVLEVSSASGSAFRDASTVELLALIVDDFGILDDNSQEEDKARLESIVGLFKEFLTSPDSEENQQYYYTLSAQSTVSSVVLDRNTAPTNAPLRGLFITLGSPFDPAAVRARSQKAIANL